MKALTRKQGEGQQEPGGGPPYHVLRIGWLEPRLAWVWSRIYFIWENEILDYGVGVISAETIFKGRACKRAGPLAGAARGALAGTPCP